MAGAPRTVRSRVAMLPGDALRTRGSAVRGRPVVPRLAAAFLVTLSSGLLAQQPKATASSDANRIHVGDQLTLTITVNHDSGSTINWPRGVEQLGPFEVLAFDVRGSDSARVTITTFELGDLTIPAIEIGVQYDGRSELVSTEPLSIVVESVGLDEAGDIRDIKPPLGIPRNLWTLALWGITLAAVLGLGWLIYRRLRRRSRPDSGRVAPREPPRPAHVIALEALDRLEASNMLERGEVKRYFTEASTIIRVYIDGRFGIDALEMTSDDILHALEHRRTEPNRIDIFRDFFWRADLVKFAKHRPNEQACRELIPTGRHLVEVTRQADDVPPSRPASSEVSIDGRAPDAIGANSALPEDLPLPR